MVQKQTNLAEWTAGFFDGDGSISAEVQKDEGTDVGYHLSPRCTVRGSFHGGFVDAEGSISAKVRENDNCQTGYSLGPVVAVKHSQTSTPLVEKLCEFPESVGVEYTVHKQEMDKEAHADQFVFKITGITNVMHYLRELYPHLVLKKPQAELMVEEILPRMSVGKHTNKRGFLQTMEYIDEMNSMKGGLRGKYNVEYFEDMWGLEV